MIHSHPHRPGPAYAITAVLCLLQVYRAATHFRLPADLDQITLSEPLAFSPSLQTHPPKPQPPQPP